MKNEDTREELRVFDLNDINTESLNENSFFVLTESDKYFCEVQSFTIQGYKTVIKYLCPCFDKTSCHCRDLCTGNSEIINRSTYTLSTHKYRNTLTNIMSE